MKRKVPPLRKPNPKTPFRRQSLYWLSCRFFSVAILSSLASSCHRYGTSSYAIVVLCSGRINRAWTVNKDYVMYKRRLAVGTLQRESSSQCSDRRGTQLDVTHWCFDTSRQREALNSALGNSNTTSPYFHVRHLQLNFSLLQYCQHVTWDFVPVATNIATASLTMHFSAYYEFLFISPSSVPSYSFMPS